MKKILRIALAVIAILAAAVLVRFAVLGHDSRTGRAPGLVAGALAPCPDKPNCVCSELDEAAAHYIAPLDYSGAPAQRAWGELLQIIRDLGGEVAVANDEYIAATFSSAVFGFVDDVECRLDAPEQRIQIRSASRVGHSDFGVNRRRVESIARSFDRRASGDASGAVGE